MRALVLLSGGLDSAVATWWALDQEWEVTALSFDYDNRPPPEAEATRALADRAGVELLSVPVPWLRELEDPPHPRLDNDALADVAPGYIPNRNLIFYSVAAHYAELLGAGRIVGGHTGDDPDTFPDARGDFFERLGALAREGSVVDHPVRIVQPLDGMDKRAVVALGLSLGAPIDLSWSCYELGPRPCGRCPSCTERAEAFAALGVADPAHA